MDHEEIDESKPLTIFHPTYTWKTQTFENYYVERLLKPLFIDGKLVREKKSVMEYRADSIAKKNCFWPQYKRISNPEPFKVDLSQELWNLKSDLIKELKKHY